MVNSNDVSYCNTIRLLPEYVYDIYGLLILTYPETRS